MTRGNVAVYLLLAWEWASEDAFHLGWECYRPDAGVLEGGAGSCPR
jgi:hypothetical protein